MVGVQENRVRNRVGRDVVIGEKKSGRQRFGSCASSKQGAQRRAKGTK
jgi:hypothetical protein